MPSPFTGLLYRLIRRLHLSDVTRLMHWDGTPVQWPAPPAGYCVRVLEDDEIVKRCGRDGAPETLSDGSELPRRDRVCVATFFDDRLVSYLWLGRGHIEAENNFSRSPHLGTSLDLPHATGFVYNAWTHPDHRGRRLIGGMLGYVTEHRLLGTTTLLTTMDWTNESSRRAFAHIGMRSMGLIWRLGHGRWQLTFVPRTPRVTGLRLATTAPGLVVGN